MKNRWVRGVAVVLGFAICAWTQVGWAQIPPLIRYQGRLSDSVGNPLNGSYSLTFKVYDAVSGGTVMWQETQSGIVVTGGNFSVLLGAVTPLALKFDQDCWLGVAVNGGVEMTPRHRVASVPNAYLSDKAEKLYQSETIQSGNLLKNGSFESWSAGTSVAPDGWVISGGTIAQEAVNYKLGQLAATLTVATGSEALKQVFPASTVNYLKGQKLTLCAWVKAPVAGKVRLKINDGIASTVSADHAGNNAWAMLSVTHTVSATATTLEAQLMVDASASATIDCVSLNQGVMPFAFAPNLADSQLVPRTMDTGGTVTTTSTAYVTIPGLTCSNVTVDGTQSVLVVFSGSTSNTNPNGGMVFRIVRDGGTQIAWNASDTPYTTGPNRQVPIGIVGIDRKPPAGPHTYTVQWYTSTGTAYAWAGQFSAVVIPDA